jgi:hypothetical protein
MKSVRSFVAIALATTALCAPVEPRALAQTPPSQYFPQTGLTVRGDFLQFFNTHGGLEIFGYPLTVEFVQGGQLVQYFQRARMEARPAGPDPVRLGSLATELGYGAPSISENIRSINDPNRRYFRETGHTVAYSFLQYFDAHGSLDIFGYPITEFQWENGRLVQYFQRARMEWHPEFPENQRVQLGNLGEIYATTRLDPSVLRPDPALAVPDAQRIASLRATAFLRWAVTRPTGQQTLYVYVLDQRGQPVQGAPVTAVVRFPSGDRSMTLAATNADGYTQATFDLGQLDPGQLVVVEASASWAALAAETQTSFFVWW